MRSIVAVGVAFLAVGLTAVAGPINETKLIGVWDLTKAEGQDEDRPGRVEPLLERLQGRAALAGVLLVILEEEGHNPAAEKIQARLGNEADGGEAEDADLALLFEGAGQGLDPGPRQAANRIQVLALQALEPAELAEGQEHLLFAEGEPAQQDLASGELELLRRRRARQETLAAAEDVA